MVHMLRMELQNLLKCQRRSFASIVHWRAGFPQSERRIQDISQSGFSRKAIGRLHAHCIIAKIRCQCSIDAEGLSAFGHWLIGDLNRTVWRFV